MRVLVIAWWLVALAVLGAEARSVRQSRACGLQTCPAAPTDKLNVHLIAHTHDDVGWLKTVGQYYFGSREGIQKAGVQYVLDSVTDELLKDETKRFIYVESSFFWAWWNEQDDATKADFQMLVDEGRLEFISGAWSMNDEATTNYQSIVDQFTWGLRFLNDTLGECSRPRVGWQIDPFGHSREMASLLAQFGFDGLFFGRLDYEDKRQRLATQTMEMIWEGSPDNLGASSDIFTQAMYNTYFSPPGFCWDIYCNDDPMIDNPRSREYNVPARVEQFLNYVQTQASNYRTNNILVTMGSDFHYQYAHSWFKNLDKLIKYVNENQTAVGGNVNLFYSTPSCYLNAVNSLGITDWPVKQDDFFPYGSDGNSYWTGYFTSKPSIKYIERLGNNLLQVSKQLVSLSGAGAADDTGVTPLRQAMGIMQHHDAITGTMKGHVAHDYARIMTSAMVEADRAAETAVKTLLTYPAADIVTSCFKLNMSQCAISEDSETFVVNVYNPLSRAVSHMVRVPVQDFEYTVQNHQGASVAVQLVPIPASVLDLPGRVSSAVLELVFQAVDLPPLSLRSYYVTRGVAGAAIRAESRADSVGNAQVNVSLADDGSPLSVTINGVDVGLQQSYSYYIGVAAAGERASGAYIFRPQSGDTVALPIQSSVVYKGELVEEAHQVFEGGWVSQIIRVYKDDNHVEFQWVVGPIPVGLAVGKEVIVRYTTDLVNNGTFTTDANGRELLERRLNYRPTWTTNVTEPVASNYYPVTSKLVLKDVVRDVQAAVFVDRAQGGTSLNDGDIELMLHRRLFKDDGFGVDEALNEIAFATGLVARGTHYLTVGAATPATTPSAQTTQRLLAQKQLVKPWLFFTPADGTTYEDWAATHAMETPGAVQGGWPGFVHVMTLEPWSDGRLLLRLEHLLEKGEDPLLADTVVVNLQDMFPAWTLVSALETTLGANQWVEEVSRMQWRTYEDAGVVASTPVDVTVVSLDPMQIRTFILTVQPL